MLAWLLMVPVDGLVCVGTESWLSEELVQRKTGLAKSCVL